MNRFWIGLACFSLGMMVTSFDYLVFTYTTFKAVYWGGFGLVMFMLSLVIWAVLSDKKKEAGD